MARAKRIRKKPLHFTLQLSQAMRLHKLFYPFHSVSKRTPEGEKVSRDALVREMFRDGFVRMRSGKGGIAARFLYGQRKPVTFAKVHVTRLGPAMILANKLARMGTFENLGKYFRLEGKNLVRKGKQRTLHVQSRVALAYVLLVMHDLGTNRAIEWEEQNPGKELPKNFVPTFLRRNILDVLESEKLSGRDRTDTAISSAERLKRYERPVRFDDLDTDNRRFQIEREKVINFAVFLLQHKSIWSMAQAEFDKLWREDRKYHLQRQLGGKRE